MVSAWTKLRCKIANTDYKCKDIRSHSFSTVDSSWFDSAFRTSINIVHFDIAKVALQPHCLRLRESWSWRTKLRSEWANTNSQCRDNRLTTSVQLIVHGLTQLSAQGLIFWILISKKLLSGLIVWDWEKIMVLAWRKWKCKIANTDYKCRDIRSHSFSTVDSSWFDWVFHIAIDILDFDL